MCILNRSLRMVRIRTGLNWLHTARYRTSAVSQQSTAFNPEDDAWTYTNTASMAPVTRPLHNNASAHIPYDNHRFNFFSPKNDRNLPMGTPSWRTHSDTSPLKRCLLLVCLALVVTHLACNWRILYAYTVKNDVSKNGVFVVLGPGDTFGLPRAYIRQCGTGREKVPDLLIITAKSP